MIVQPETVFRWRRNGCLALWRYRSSGSSGRWRGGRPRISSELRNLMRQMAQENFLWGAPRIHGELLMLGYTVSQATVSRYLPAPGRRPTQSWRSFLRNQASALGHYPEARSGGYAGLHLPSSCDPRPRRWRRSVLDSSVALDADRPPRTPEKSVYAPPSAGETLCTECLGSPRYLLVYNKRVAIACRSQLRCETHPLKVGPRRGLTQRANRILPFWWTRF
jgi:hypothetical protein